MTESGPRFCPRCGAGSVAGMPFCPQCGFDLADLPRQDPKATEPAALVPAVSTRPTDIQVIPPTKPEVARPTLRPIDRLTARGRGIPPVVVAGLLVMIGLIGYGFLTRPVATPAPAGGGFGPPGGAGGSAAPALISGLTILSPTDGQAVAAKDVNVIGTAPPGVTITQDISFGLDQHTTSDGTGHWSIRVGLKEGENKLVFRIGDDASTRREIRVVYTPAAQG